MAYRAGWLLALGIADAMLVWADAPPALKAAAIALLVFLLPGVAALAALFPERDQLDGWERLGVGGAAGLALSMQAAWLAMLVPGGMDKPVLLVILNAVTLGLGLAALWRMARLPAAAAPPPAAPRAVWRENATGLCLLALVVLFTFLWSDYTEFDHDEVPVISAAVASIAGFERAVFTLLKGPAQIVLAAIFMLLGGDISEGFLRASTGIGAVLAALVLWRLSRRLAGGGAALAVLALWLVEGIHTGQSRWLQFQSQVLLNSVAAVWCYSQATGTTGSVRARLHALGAFLFGASLFAHFGGAFAAPALALLWWLAERHALRQRATWLRAGTLALIMALVAAPFYLLMISQPGLSARVERYYLGLRVGDPPYNSMDNFAARLVVLESPEWLLLLIAGVLLAGVTIGAAYTARGRVRGAFWWATLTGAVLAMLFPSLLSVAGVNLSFVPFALLTLLLALVEGTSPAMRLAGVWALGAWFYPAFWMLIPGDHFYGALPGLCIVIVLGAREAWSRWGARVQWRRAALVRYGAPAFFLLWVAGAAVYTFMMYVSHRPEYAMLYPDARPPLAVFNAERPPLLYGAYPHQSGWRAVAALYARGELRGEYETNELKVVNDWYLQQAWAPEPPHPRYYFEVVRPFAPILGSALPADLAQTHWLAGEVTVEGETRMRIHQRRDGGSPPPVQTWSVESLAADWRDLAVLSRLLTYRAEGRDDTAFYAIARQLEREGVSGDVVLLDGALGRGLLAKFYTGDLPLLVSLDGAEARAARRIWGVYWASPDRASERAAAERACPAESEWHNNVRLTLNGVGATGAPRVLDAQFGNYARLQTVALGEAVRGGILCVQFSWQTMAPTETAHKLFVHLIAPDGSLAAQSDLEPLAGFMPSTAWRAGGHFASRAGVLLPAALPAGEYRLAAGLYASDSGERLPATVAGARSPGDAVDLGPLTLR